LADRLLKVGRASPFAAPGKGWVLAEDFAGSLGEALGVDSGETVTEGAGVGIVSGVEATVADALAFGSGGAAVSEGLREATAVAAGEEGDSAFGVADWEGLGAEFAEGVVEIPDFSSQPATKRARQTPGRRKNVLTPE
jgi:hypothetical protein